MTNAQDVQKKLGAFRAYLASKSPALQAEFSKQRAETSVAFYVMRKLQTFLRKAELERWAATAEEFDFKIFLKILAGQELGSTDELDQLVAELQLLGHSTNRILKFYRNDKSGMFIMQFV